MNKFKAKDSSQTKIHEGVEKVIQKTTSDRFLMYI